MSFFCLKTLMLSVFGRDHDYKFSIVASFLPVIGHSKVEWAMIESAVRGESTKVINV